MTPLERITERVARHGDVNLSETVRPILTLSEFFDGNNVNGTIGCNLDPPPSPAQFHSMLKAIVARPQVSDVRIVVTQFDDPAWPFSDTVWVITSATPDEVSAWFDKAVRPTECWEGWYPDHPAEPVNVPAGMRIVTCQWD
jgi:hypothetical protein